MNERKFVQYKNDPNGTKWEAVDDCPRYWRVDGGYGGGVRYLFELPKSEYAPCSPPERWKDVTAEFDMSLTGRFAALESQRITIELCGNVSGYRLRKVQLYEERGPIVNGDLSDDDYIARWAFIVEKRED